MPSKAKINELYPPCLIKDVLSDLPTVTNWSLAESHSYAK